MSSFTHSSEAIATQKLGIEHLQPGQSAFNWREGLAGRNTPVDRSAKPKNATRVNSYSDTARNTNSDKTNAIVGRRNNARSQ